MSNLTTLIKLNLRETLDTRKFKENKARTTSLITMIAFVVILTSAISIMYNYIIASQFHVNNIPVYNHMYLIMGLSTFLIFTTGITRVKSIFIGKDYDLLTALPIKKRDIVISKIVSMYLYELVFSVIVCVPGIIFSYYFNNNIMILLTGFIGVILVPMFPLAVSALVSLLFTLIADRFRVSNIINTILYLIFFIILMTFMMLSSTTENAEDMTSMFNSLSNGMKWINPSLLLVGISISSSPLYLLLFILTSLLAGAIPVLIIALLFDKVHEVVTSVKGNKKYIKTELKEEHPGKTLFKIELKRLFSSKLYLINSVSGSIVGVVMTVILVFSFRNSTSGMDDMINSYIHLAAIFVVLILGMTTTSSIGISIEGNNFWLIKSLPINYKTYAKVKVFLSTLVLGIPALISSIIIIIGFRPGLLTSLVIIIFPLAYVFFMSTLSFIINLHNYNFKWKNEADVVKRSSSVLFTLLIDFGVSIGLFIISLVISLFSSIASMLVLVGIIGLLSFIVYRLLINGVDKNINKIENF